MVKKCLLLLLLSSFSLLTRHCELLTD